MTNTKGLINVFITTPVIKSLIITKPLYILYIIPIPIPILLLTTKKSVISRVGVGLRYAYGTHYWDSRNC